MLLALFGGTLAISTGLLLVRADRALTEARDIRHGLVEDRRRAEDALHRMVLALRRVEGAAEAVDRQRSQVEEAMALVGAILRSEHDEALKRHR